MKWTALLAVAAFLLAVGTANAAPTAKAKTIKGTVVAKHVRSGTVVLAGPRHLGVTVRLAARRVHLGDRVSVAGKRLRDGTIRASRLHVLSHVKRTRIRGVVVKRLARGLRIATGHSVLTIHTNRRALADHGDGHGDQVGEMGEFEIEIEDGGLFEQSFQSVSASGTVEIEGRLVTVSPLVVSVEGLPITITVPSGVTLPPLTVGQEVELTIQAGANNTFTLVSIDDAVQPADDVEAKGLVTDSTTSRITIDAGGAMLTFAAPAGVTLPILAVGTHVEARGVTINGVLTLQRLRTEDGDGGGDH